MSFNMLDSIFLATLAVVICIVYYLLRQRREIHLPGPPGKPLLGSILDLDIKKPHQTLAEWGRMYGPAYVIKVLGEQVVVLSAPSTIREIMSTKASHFDGRPYIFRVSYFFPTYEIALTNPSEQWRLLKKVVLSSLRGGAHDAAGVDALLHRILEMMGEDIRAAQSEPIDLKHIIHKNVTRYIALVLFGFVLEDDLVEEYINLEQEINDVSSIAGPGIELEMMPWLRYLPNKTFAKMKSMRPRIHSWFRQNINQHARGVLDHIASELESLNNSSQCAFSEDHILSLAMDMMVAGTINTTVTLYSMVGILASQQDVQDRVRKNIVDTKGYDPLNPEDRKALPLVESLILETLRYFTPVPIWLPHLATQQSSITGITIPKNTQVWVNCWAVHHDEAVWEDPWMFKADRMLNESGDLFPASSELWKGYLPFGRGVRSCAGEFLARRNLFMFATYLLQNFSFLPESESAHIDTDPRNFDIGISLEPVPFKVKALAVDRN